MQYARKTAVLGDIHHGVGLPVLPAAVESGGIVIALSYTTAAANGVVATWFELNTMN